MVDGETTTTKTERRIEEFELTTGSELVLRSNQDDVPDRTPLTKPGRYLLIRLGDIEHGDWIPESDEQDLLGEAEMIDRIPPEPFEYVEEF